MSHKPFFAQATTLPYVRATTHVLTGLFLFASTSLTTGCATRGPIQEGFNDIVKSAQRAFAKKPDTAIPAGVVIEQAKPDIQTTNIALYDMTPTEGARTKIWAVDMKDKTKTVFLIVKDRRITLKTFDDNQAYNLVYTIDPNGKLNFSGGTAIRPGESDALDDLPLVEKPSLRRNPSTQGLNKNEEMFWATQEVSHALSALNRGEHIPHPTTGYETVTRLGAGGSYSKIYNQGQSTTTAISGRESTTVVTTFPGTIIPDIVTDRLPNEPRRGADFLHLVETSFRGSAWTKFFDQINQKLPRNYTPKQRENIIKGVSASLLNYHFNQSAMAREVGRRFYKNPQATPPFTIFNWFTDTLVDKNTGKYPAGFTQLEPPQSIGSTLLFFESSGLDIRKPAVTAPQTKAAVQKKTAPKKPAKNKHRKAATKEI